MDTDSPSVRLACCPDSESSKQGTNVRAAIAFDATDRQPALLVSFVYLKPFLIHRHRYHFRDWVLDSGAFSAFQSGTQIKLQDYIDTAKRLIAEDPKLTEVFALDVIGDWKSSLRNTEEMWRQGIRAIPCYHCGEPESVLRGLAKDYPKIALGGVAVANRHLKTRFASECFARVWPKPIHGFGYGKESHIMAFPWHSVDATNWEADPCRFGRWRAFGCKRLSVRGSSQNLRAEVEWYLKLEDRARDRWRNEMAKLNAGDLTLRLAEGNAANVRRREDAFGSHE
jgi:hypothetical protein